MSNSLFFRNPEGDKPTLPDCPGWMMPIKQVKTLIVEINFQLEVGCYIIYRKCYLIYY